jgi:predicted TPR repeat methyltransferase
MQLGTTAVANVLRLQEARELSRQGRVQEAVARCRGVLLSEPGNFDALLLLGSLACAARQFEAAIELLRAALCQNNRSALAHNELGAALMALRRFPEALECFDRAAQLSPRAAGIYSNRGNALLALERPDAAMASYDKALRLQPMSAATHNGRGCALNRLGRTPEAIDSWQRALQLDPSCHDALGNLANALQRQGRDEEAARCYRTAVALRPDHAGLHCNLGLLLLRMGDRTGALSAFEAALRHDPESPTAKHLVAALRGETLERPPDGYVEQLFDSCSGDFERVLVQELQYRTPQLLAQSLANLCPPLPAAWDVLDLGCGTGLCGSAVAEQSRQLVGVDVSAKMLAQARERGIYSRLEKQELVSWMSAEPQQAFDLVIAADVFIYFGRLDEAVRAVRRILRSSGAFAFSGESIGTPANTERAPADFELTATGRYAHSEAYLQRLAAQHDFRIEKHMAIECRLEHNTPVDGWLAVWRPAT